jgi:hypothetical protein
VAECILINLSRCNRESSFCTDAIALSYAPSHHTALTPKTQEEEKVFRETSLFREKSVFRENDIFLETHAFSDTQSCSLFRENKRFQRQVFSETQGFFFPEKTSDFRETSTSRIYGQISV